MGKINQQTQKKQSMKTVISSFIEAIPLIGKPLAVVYKKLGFSHIILFFLGFLICYILMVNELIPNVFNIMPSEVYRVYVDGRPDELVAGVDLIGTPLTMFSNIICGGDNQGIFSGFCGAESGYVPVTAISPALFVRKIETQKGMEIKTDVPLLPSPTIRSK
jgi:hypothetical protein